MIHPLSRGPWSESRCVTGHLQALKLAHVGESGTLVRPRYTCDWIRDGWIETRWRSSCVSLEALPRRNATPYSLPARVQHASDLVVLPGSFPVRRWGGLRRLSWDGHKAPRRACLSTRLLQWERGRKTWLGVGGGAPVGRRRRARARTMDVDEVIENLFPGRGGGSNLPQYIPLPQMIDLLVDLWEAEGLFD